jgi:hypothetical protein
MLVNQTYRDKFHSFRALSALDKKIFLLAIIYLAWGRILISTPLRWWKHYIKTDRKDSDHKMDVHLDYKIARAVKRMASQVPWQTKCLVQSIAKVCIYKHFGIKKAISLGLEKNEHSELIAHAWLKNIEKPGKFVEII